MPGVQAATPVLIESDQRLATDELGTDARMGQATVLLVDGPGLATVTGASDVDAAVPAVLRSARAEPGPLPAIVSPAVAADLSRGGLADSAFISVQGQRYEFRVAGSQETFPLLPGEHRPVRHPALAGAADADHHPRADQPAGRRGPS